jgi:hypothetical protein
LAIETAQQGETINAFDKFFLLSAKKKRISFPGTVARFFLVQNTKMGKMAKTCTKCPLNIPNVR